MSRVNIVKKVKLDGNWKLLSIPRNGKGNYDWNALPEGLYLIEWRAGGKRRRESAAARSRTQPRRHRWDGHAGRRLEVQIGRIAGAARAIARVHVPAVGRAAGQGDRGGGARDGGVHIQVVGVQIARSQPIGGRSAGRAPTQRHRAAR